jgi:hypothetical protein
MNNLDVGTRRRVASLATALYAHEIDYESFLAGLPPIDYSEDDPVTELLDLIAHEPTRGRFLGVSMKRHAEYIADIQNRVAELAADGSDRDRAI